MRKAELILIGVIVLGLILKIFKIPGNSILLILSLGTLASIYFYFGILLFNNIGLRKIFKKDSYKGLSSKRIIGSLALGIALSVLVIGILFKIEIWPGADNMLLPGLFLLSVILIVLFYYSTRSKSPFGKRVHNRILIVAATSMLLYFIPTDALIDIYHRNNPEIRRLYKEALKDPSNQEAQKKLQAAFEKERDTE